MSIADQLSDARAENADLKREIERVRRERDRFQTELSQANRLYEKEKIAHQIGNAARRAGAHEAAIEDIVARAIAEGEWGVDSAGKLRRVTNGVPEVDSSGQYIAPDNWVRALVSSAGYFFGSAPAESAKAAGTVGPVGDNPFAKESWNLTKQGAEFEANPERAKVLARQAGWTEEDIDRKLLGRQPMRVVFG